MSEQDANGQAERHLAAILAADIVGYSQRMEHDEVGTLRSLGDLRRNLIEPKVTEHRGRIFKTMGDGFLAEFVSVLGAVHCAVDIQRLMADRNLDLPQESRLLLRMGINLGDVFREGDDVFGDGVNIAARLESIAPPGGIYISRTACDPIRDRLAFDFTDLGEHQVKNITRPIHVFGVRIEGESGTEEKALFVPAPSRYRVTRSLWLLAIVAVLTAAGMWWVFGRPEPSYHPITAMQSTASLEAKATAQEMVDAELVFWSSISGSGTAADFEEYLRKYPDGRFAGLARNRLATLQASAPASPSTAPLPVENEPPLTTDQRREVQRALRALGHFQGEADGAFGMGTQSALKQFQSFLGDPETGTLTRDERKALLDMAQRLAILFDQPATSPLGVAGLSIKNSTERYIRAYNFENGKGTKPDTAEAAYWYALAAADGEPKAFVNLGRLLARGWGSTQPNPNDAALVWWVAAARGEASALFNEGVLYEQGMGVNADLARARQWYERAAALNDVRARDALKRLGS